MTGLERNADLVIMSCYAPLFGHEDRWQWRPDLIWFDNLQSYGSANYYVQQVFSLNRGDVVLPVEVSGQEPPSSQQPGLYVTSSRDSEKDEIIVKVVNSAAQPATAEVKIEGIKRVSSKSTVTVLAAGSLTDENSLAEPRKIAPVTSRLKDADVSFPRTFPPYSLSVLRLRVRD